MRKISLKKKIEMSFWTARLKVMFFLKDVFSRDSEFLQGSRKRYNLEWCN
jgi:hypothetical protein